MRDSMPIISLDDLESELRRTSKAAPAQTTPVLSLDDLEAQLKQPSDTWGQTLSKVGQRTPALLKNAASGLAEPISDLSMKALQNYARPNEGILDFFTQPYREKAAMLALLAGYSGAPQKLHQLRESAETELARPELQHNINKGKFHPQQLTADVLESAIQSSPAIVTGLVAGPAAGLAVGALQSGSQGYTKHKKAGATPGEAALAGLGYGISETVFEKTPMGYLLKIGSGPVKNFVKYLASEAGGEAANQFAQNTIDKMTINPNMTLEDMIEDSVHAGIIGVGQAGVYSTVAAPANILRQKIIDPKGIKAAAKEAEAAPNINKSKDAQYQADLQELAMDEAVGDQRQVQEGTEIIPENIQGEHPQSETRGVNNPEVQSELSQLFENKEVVKDLSKRYGKDTVDNLVAQAQNPDFNAGEVLSILNSDKKVAEIMAKQKETTIKNEVKQVYEGEQALQSALSDPTIRSAIEDVYGSELISQVESQLGNEGFALKEVTDLLTKNPAVKKAIDNRVDELTQERLAPPTPELVENAETQAPELAENATPEVGTPEFTEQVLGDLKNKLNLPEGLTQEQAAPKPKKIKAARNIQERADNFQTDLQELVKKINPNIEAEFVEGALQARNPITKKIMNLKGLYDHKTKKLKVALEGKDADTVRSTLHETWHSLEDLLNPEEQNILKAAYPGDKNVKLPKGYKKADMQREWAAEQFADYMMGKTEPKGTVAKVFHKLKEFIDGIFDSMDRNNIKTPQDVFNLAASGEIASRMVDGKDISFLIKDDKYKELDDKLFTDEDAEAAAKELGSPELEALLKQKFDPESMAGLAEIKAEATDNPKDMSASIRAGVEAGKETWRDIAKKTIRIVKKANPLITDKKLEALDTEINETYEAMSKSSKEGKISDSLRHFQRLIANTNDGYLRNLADVKSSEALRDIADMFYADLGEGRSVARTYFKEKETFIDSHLHRLMDIVGNTSDATLEQITPYLQGYRNAKPGSYLDQQVQKFKELQEDIKDYLKSSGIEVGDVEGYFRRLYDNEAILHDKEGFIKAASKAYMMTAMKDNVDLSTKDAVRMAEDWFNRVALEDNGTGVNSSFFYQAGPPALSSQFKSRKLSKDADEIMRNYLVQNPIDAFSLSITQAANKVSFDRRFGGDKFAILQDRLEKNGVDNKDALALVKYFRDNGIDSVAPKFIEQHQAEMQRALEEAGVKDADEIVDDVFYLWEKGANNRWSALKQRMLDEGVSPDELSEVISVVKQNTGMAGREFHPSIQSASNAARVYSYVAHLPVSVLTQLGEFSLVGVQTGSPKLLLKSFTSTLNTFVNKAIKGAGFTPSEKYEYLNNLSGLLGIVSNQANAALLRSRYGLEHSGKLSRIITDRFFRKTGQASLTEANQIAAVECGQLFFHNLAQEILQGGNKRKSSEIYFKDYGIPENDIVSFSEFIMDANKAFTNKDINFFNGKGKNNKLYETAINRFVDSVIINPNAAQRHRIANHPVGGLIYGFMSYTMGFTKDVLLRNAALAKKSVSKSEELTLQDRLQLASGLAMLPTMWALTHGIAALKDAISGDTEEEKKKKKKTGTEHFLEALKRSSMFGGFDPLIGAYESISKYRQHPLLAVSGPVFQDVDKLIKSTIDLFGENNSPNTNTAERNAAKNYYNLVALPIINASVPVLVPGYVLPFLTLSGLNLPAGKKKVVNAIAGEPYRKAKFY